MMKRVNIECSNCSVSSCFVKLSGSINLNHLSQQKKHIIYRKGELIFKKGYDVRGMYFVQDGMVKIEDSDINGVPRIVRLGTAGQLLGEPGFGERFHKVTSTVFGDCRVCFLSNEQIFEAFQLNFQFLFKVMLYYSDELQKSEHRSICLAQMSVDEKVVYALLYIAECFGYAGGTGRLNLTLTRSEIGSIVGVNAEQVSRAISGFRKIDVLDTEGNSIFIKDIKNLEKIVSKYSCS